MPSSELLAATANIFEAVRRDAAPAAISATADATRAEFIWATHVLSRLTSNRRQPGFTRRYLRAMSNLSKGRELRRAPDETSRVFEDLLAALRAPRSRAAATRLAKAVACLIDDADARACISITDSLAHAALPLCRSAWPVAYGNVLWRAARARRKAGDLVSANRHYASVLAIGRRQNEHALIARGAMGLAILARELGNTERVIHLFEEAHEHAQQSKSRELQILGHQGMQIAAGVVGDHAGELRHVWLAYSLSIGDPVHEYEALNNVAWYACRAGIANEALPALQNVLRNVPLKPQLRFHYLGTTAIAAAQCGRKDVLDVVRGELDPFKESVVHPHEHGLALASLCESYEWLGNRQLAREYRGAVRLLAKRFGFNELLQRLQSPKIGVAVAAAADSESFAEIEEIRRVLRTIAAGVLTMQGESATV